MGSVPVSSSTFTSCPAVLYTRNDTSASTGTCQRMVTRPVAGLGLALSSTRAASPAPCAPSVSVLLGIRLLAR